MLSFKKKIHAVPDIKVYCRAGDFAAEFTTQRMAWAAIKGDQIYSGLEPGDCIVNGLH